MRPTARREETTGTEKTRRNEGGTETATGHEASALGAIAFPLEVAQHRCEKYTLPRRCSKSERAVARSTGSGSSAHESSGTLSETYHYSDAQRD